MGRNNIRQIRFPAWLRRKSRKLASEFYELVIAQRSAGTHTFKIVNGRVITVEIQFGSNHAERGGSISLDSLNRGAWRIQSHTRSRNHQRARIAGMIEAKSKMRDETQ